MTYNERRMTGITPERVADLIAEVLRPGHFFVANGRELTCLHLETEESAWEIFRGRLLDPAHTRERKVFRSWNLYLSEEKQRRSGKPKTKHVKRS